MLYSAVSVAPFTRPRASLLTHAAFSLIATIAIARPALAQDTVAPPAFARDIAPLIYSHCVECHRAGGDAPFALTTYDEVRRRATMIADATGRGYMPPWKPAAGAGDFIGARRLGPHDIATLRRWAEAGAPEGPPGVLPRAPASTSGWLHGEPDLILPLAPYQLKADGPDVFRNFVVAIPGGGRRYVRGWQFRPGTTAVHHANIRVDSTAASRRLDAADPDGGYEGLILRSAQFPGGHFLAWTPGHAPPPSDGDIGWPIDAGSDLVVQLHMRPTGKLERVAATVGLYLTDTPPARPPSVIRLGRQDLDIPAGAANHRVSDTWVLPVDVELRAIQPHSHYRARSVRADAKLPGGSTLPLLRIDDWDFNWQDQYRYRSPVALPAGTTLSIDYTFDNSAANPRNPTVPPARASWGWRSADEMADVWFQVVTRSAGDQQRLDTEAERRMLGEDVIGGERILQREPDHVALRNDTALAYLAIGRPADALRHFQAVTALTRSASAWFNEAVAYEALNRFDDAARCYAAAIEVDPGYAAAHNNLGSVRVRQGRPDVAREHYEQALRADAGYTAAYANLALVLAAQREPDAALASARQALAREPAYLTRMTPFVWLLVAASDPAMRRASEGRELAERIVSATNRRDADALDALGAAAAATGDFTLALSTSSEALRLIGDLDPARARDIRTRQRLYERREPFVFP